MAIKIVINPDNPTELWGTFDGRKPTYDDHDFGADWYYNEGESEKVAQVVAAVEVAIGMVDINI